MLDYGNIEHCVIAKSVDDQWRFFLLQEEEKKKMKEQRQKEIEAFLAETNNNEEKNQTIKIKAVDIAQIKINNKEKGKLYYHTLWGFF